MNDFKVVNNKMITQNGDAISFDFDIMNTITIGEIVVVLLEIQPSQKENDNIYGVKNGRVVWKIESYLKLNSNFSQTSYVLINKDQQGNIIATDFCGCRFVVDPSTGRIIGRSSFVK